MKPQPDERLKQWRVRVGPLASDDSLRETGAFIIPGPLMFRLQVIVGRGMGWEHVSVTTYRKNRTPTWDEMCFIKDIFWDSEETVIQYHPPRSEYVNNHNYVLHLWKPIGQNIPLPPSILVGIKPKETAVSL